MGKNSKFEEIELNIEEKSRKRFMLKDELERLNQDINISSMLLLLKDNEKTYGSYYACRDHIKGFEDSFTDDECLKLEKYDGGLFNKDYLFLLNDKRVLMMSANAILNPYCISTGNDLSITARVLPLAGTYGVNRKISGTHIDSYLRYQTYETNIFTVYNDRKGICKNYYRPDVKTTHGDTFYFDEVLKEMSLEDIINRVLTGDKSLKEDNVVTKTLHK